NISEHRNGAVIYDKFVRPAIVTLPRLGAHYAVSSLFNPYIPYEEQSRIYCYKVDREDYRKQESGRTILIVGKARFSSVVTMDSGLLTFAVLFFAGHNLVAGVLDNQPEDRYQQLVLDLNEPFSRSDLPEVIRILDRAFEGMTYSLNSLF